jgi:hypothetical protein
VYGWKGGNGMAGTGQDLQGALEIYTKTVTKQVETSPHSGSKWAGAARWVPVTRRVMGRVWAFWGKKRPGPKIPSGSAGRVWTERPGCGPAHFWPADPTNTWYLVAWLQSALIQAEAQASVNAAAARAAGPSKIQLGPSPK